MKILKTTPDQIKAYRTNYLNGLPEFQELFLEIMISDADFYLMHAGSASIGYAIRNKEGILIEYFVIDKLVPASNEIFKQVLKELSISGVYCKTFDALLMSNCMLHNMPYSVYGVLYRDFVEPFIEKDPEITMKKSGFQSTGFYLEQDDSIKALFETENQLLNFIQNEHVFEFYLDKLFVGCGMIIRTIAGWNYCDLGVWVHPLKRGQGIGSQIILNLHEYAIHKNLKPSCGCAIDNPASQKAIEKSGYVSKHKLVHFKI